MKKIILFFIRHKVIRYLISGGTAAFANLAFLFILTEFAGMWYLT